MKYLYRGKERKYSFFEIKLNVGKNKIKYFDQQETMFLRD